MRRIPKDEFVTKMTSIKEEKNFSFSISQRIGKEWSEEQRKEEKNKRNVIRW